MSDWPRTGCSLIVRSSAGILLIRRGKQPFEGRWSLPGGAQEFGETLEECAIRELYEETALRTETIKFVAVRDRISPTGDEPVAYHYVLATFLVEAFEGEPMAGDDAKDIGWFTLDDMMSLDMTPDTMQFVDQVLSGTR